MFLRACKHKNPPQLPRGFGTAPYTFGIGLRPINAQNIYID